MGSCMLMPTYLCLPSNGSFKGLRAYSDKRLVAIRFAELRACQTSLLVAEDHPGSHGGREVLGSAVLKQYGYKITTTAMSCMA